MTIEVLITNLDTDPTRQVCVVESAGETHKTFPLSSGQTRRFYVYNGCELTLSEIAAPAPKVDFPPPDEFMRTYTAIKAEREECAKIADGESALAQKIARHIRARTEAEKGPPDPPRPADGRRWEYPG